MLLLLVGVKNKLDIEKSASIQIFSLTNNLANEMEVSKSFRHFECD